MFVIKLLTHSILLLPNGNQIKSTIFIAISSEVRIFVLIMNFIE